MQHTITTSADGSSTLQLTEFAEAYHSTNGAFTEAMHIYIKAGVEHLFHAMEAPECINVFDVGFGTGLNCILLYAWQQTLISAGLPYPKIRYFGIEKYPIQPAEAQELNYPNIIAQNLALIPDDLSAAFTFMHNCPWEKEIPIPPLNKVTGSLTPQKDNANTFTLQKNCADIVSLGAEYYKEKCTGQCCTIAPAVVFYDTFSPATQPHLWSEEIFRNIASGCPSGSVLVTYCSKGTVKQALRGAGFTLERLAGPPGKRHILRGTL